VGAGIDSFAIMTDGNIDACPIAPEMPFYHIGNIYESNPEDLRNSMHLKSPCNICNYLWVCGGRCLFANRTKFWGEKLFDRVCKATIHMIKELERNISHIKSLIDSKIIDEYDFDYPEFNNGCEIIP
jgi:radical SAM protein with 4Fe4S-binding SPASM domain